MSVLADFWLLPSAQLRIKIGAEEVGEVGILFLCKKLCCYYRQYYVFAKYFPLK